MASDAIILVTKDHRAVENLFATLKEKTGDRAQLLEQLRAELIAHAKAEEIVLYPFIKKALPDERAQVDEGSKEHHEVESMVEKLSGLSADDKAVDTLLDQLEAAVGDHVEEEENEVLPGLEQVVDEDALRELGESFQQRKAAELSRLVGGGSPAKTKDSAKGSAKESGGEAASGKGGDKSDKGSDKSSAELLEEARAAGIEGRSKMSKEELAQALKASRS